MSPELATVRSRQLDDGGAGEVLNVADGHHVAGTIDGERQTIVGGIVPGIDVVAPEKEAARGGQFHDHAGAGTSQPQNSCLGIS